MINNFSKILGERLLSISEVAKSTNISRSTLTNLYYKKNKMIRYDTLIKLCDYLQVNLSDLIEYESKKGGELSGTKNRSDSFIERS